MIYRSKVGSIEDDRSHRKLNTMADDLAFICGWKRNHGLGEHAYTRRLAVHIVAMIDDMTC
jgi:hypothetical protein